MCQARARSRAIGKFIFIENSLIRALEQLYFLHHNMMQQELVPEPTSLAEVENLIKALYVPSNHQLVPNIQSKLQLLQKSSDGWQLADTLLNSEDDKVRFFGALTFTVKINSDWSVIERKII